MRVLFLDVDGVLNCTEDFRGKGTTFVVSRHRVMQVLDVVKDLNLKIVMSSTWRRSAEHMHFLHLNGIGRDLMHGDWRTPDQPRDSQIAHGHKRGYEIQLWLNEHPEVTEYAILDDDPDMLRHQKARFVNTDMGRGVTDKDIAKLRALFA